MTPEEKAEELYNNFYNIALFYTDTISSGSLAKKCAVYLVQEKLSVLQDEYMYGETLPIKEIQYWTETLKHLTRWDGEQHS